MRSLRLVQLPVPQPAAYAATGNVPLAAACLGVAARVHGLGDALALDVLAPEATDALGDTALADRIACDEPEFLGLSLYLWNVERSLHLAREVKRRSPRTTVLVGGPEVSPDNPFVVGQGGYDVAVTGEAEQMFGSLMRGLLAGGPAAAAGLPGVAVRGGDAGELGPFGPQPSARFALTEFPSPYLEGFLAVDPKRSTYVETVRGCKSHCTFCFYPRSSNVLRSLDVDASSRLIAGLRDRGAREVVFLDPTFNHRPQFEPLLDALVRVNADRAVSFFAEVRAEGLTPEHAAKLARAGFTKLEIGLQSVNPQTLNRVRRGGSPARVAEAAKMLHDVGIALLVDLIIGLPGDTPDDVARGVDFLLEHDLGGESQVFPLSLLPGTAMRADAERDGITFDSAPPYRVRRTATMSEDAWHGALFAAEERLGRRLDELPRPHLVAPEGRPDPPDVFVFDADASTAALRNEPGAQHVALWLHADDLFARRDRVLRAIDNRLTVDPYATLDVVLAPRGPFALNLVDAVLDRLRRATPSYFSRVLAHRGEDLQRRVVVVLAEETAFTAGYLTALRAEVPVYLDQPWHQALADAERLGGDLPAARIIGPPIDRSAWDELTVRADPEAVTFADRRCERAWQRRVLGYAEVSVPGEG
ncbi:MAG: B12-binding domain-containing radical SAM protein [Isosphaeraceae bacterium]|nr:B12-binding domain-containing radical SAM protein [Isosphaeraceae bacterium]